jgi:hypothetical protein
VAKENPLKFNILDARGNLVCPACGEAEQFHADALPYDDQGGVIGRGICSCCYWEPGFDDNPLASDAAKHTILESLKQYRAEWIASGYPHKSKKLALNEMGKKQLAALFEYAPYLK